MKSLFFKILSKVFSIPLMPWLSILTPPKICDVSEKEIYKKLNINRSFVYLKRSITPKEFNAIVKLKEPAIKR